MVEGTLLALLFIGILIATVRDMQVREVPDTVSLGLVAIGLLAGIIIALVREDIWILVAHLLGLLAGMAVGFAMYYTRQWGGGDAKLIMGVGAVLGLSWENLRLAEFLVLLVLLGAAYGIVYTVVLAIRKRKEFVPAFKEELRTPRVHRMRIALVISGVALVILFLFAGTQMRLLIGLALAGAYLLVYSWVFIRTVERSIMIKEYPVGKLTEGDWIAQDVVVKGKTLAHKKSTGLTLEQIAALKRAKVRKVLVREGIPFVPSFLLALMALLAIERWAGVGLRSLLAF